MRLLVEEHIAAPLVILFGGAPLVPDDGPGPCPSCGGAIHPQDVIYHCGRCSRSAPSIESRCLAARIGLKARSLDEAAEQAAKEELRKKTRKTPVLSESERRHIWYGTRDTGLDSLKPRAACIAREGREFLRSIGQEPDWSIILDRHGNAAGRMRTVPLSEMRRDEEADTNALDEWLEAS